MVAPLMRLLYIFMFLPFLVSSSSSTMSSVSVSRSPSFLYTVLIGIFSSAASDVALCALRTVERSIERASESASASITFCVTSRPLWRGSVIRRDNGPPPGVWYLSGWYSSRCSKMWESRGRSIPAEPSRPGYAAWARALILGQTDPKTSPMAAQSAAAPATDAALKPAASGPAEAGASGSSANAAAMSAA